MKKLIYISLVAALGSVALGASASAVTITSDGTTANTIGSTGTSAGSADSVDVTPAAAGAGFIKQTFTFKKSANVQLIYTEHANAGAVAANSRKGKNIFAGNTGGGAVTQTTGSTFNGGVADAPTATNISLPSS